MKLLLENWRKYLKEEDDLNAQAAELQKFVGNILAVLQAVEDSAEALEEARPGSKARSSKINSQRIRRIKQDAGLTGIKRKDFTPEQEEVYERTQQNRELAAQMGDKDQLKTLAYGNMLKLPIIRDLVRLGGHPLKVALATVSGCEQGTLNLTCIGHYFHNPAEAGLE
tara:strand:- start:99 stop:602 length:504 start_codon:yes stop_codon:yes gene_type:complete